MSRKNRGRTLKSFSRKTDLVPPRECVLIVCEGGKTEPQYFAALASDIGLRKLVEVVIHGEGCGSAPINVVEYAVEQRKKRVTEAKRSVTLTEFDTVWCVSDVEAPLPHPTLQQAQDKARGQKVKLVLSNPCFEFWYILHFEMTTALFDTNEACLKRLRKHLKDYVKSSPDTYGQLKQSTLQAIANAERALANKMCGDDLSKHNPSTHIHRLVEYLTRIAERPHK